MNSKYLTERREIDTDHLLKMGIKASEVRQVLCEADHTAAACSKCGKPASHLEELK